MNTLKKITFLMLLAPLVISCSKEETNPEKPIEQKSKTFLQLTAHAWTINDFKIDGQSIWNQAPACSKDNGLRFYDNGFAENLQGKIKCNPSDTNSVFHWSLKQNKTIVMSLLGDTDESSMEIDSINQTELHLSYDNSQGQHEALSFKKSD